MDRLRVFQKGPRLSGYVLLAILLPLIVGCQAAHATPERIAINDGWRFMKYDPDEAVDELIYDARPEVRRKRQIILDES